MQKINKFNQPLGETVENWSGAKIPEPKVLHGRLMTLEPIDVEKHGEKLFESFLFNNNGESWTYLPYGPFETYPEFESWLKNISLDNDVLLYALIDNKTLLPLGIAGYLRINPKDGSIEVGHVHYSNHLKKMPGATEAMYLLMKQVFDDWNYRRYEWKCHSLNEASRKAALRLGFQFEGIFRQTHVIKGHNRDTAWFSIIDKEWPSLKKRFEDWLHPKNFDASGKQLKNL